MYIGATGLSSQVSALDSHPSPQPEDFAANRKVVAAVQALNEAGAAGSGKEFSYTRDPQTKRRVVQIIDSQTGDVVDQIPSEYALKFAQELSDFLGTKAGSTLTGSY